MPEEYTQGEKVWYNDRIDGWIPATIKDFSTKESEPIATVKLDVLTEGAGGRVTDTKWGYVAEQLAKWNDGFKPRYWWE